MAEFFVVQSPTIVINPNNNTDPEQDTINAEAHRLAVEQAILASAAPGITLLPLPDNIGQDVGVQG
jgi:hypothetical protein